MKLRASFPEGLTLFVITALLLACSGFAWAFYTFSDWGGAIHEAITRAGLEKCGFSTGAFKIVDEGNTSQDTPGTSKFSDASHHFLDNELAASFRYMDDRLNTLCAYAANAFKDDESCRKTLYCFGEMLHPAQDFYAHTNYIEEKLKSTLSLHGSPLRPEDIPLVNWRDVAGIGKTSRSGLRAGYFYYESFSSNEGTVSRSACLDFFVSHTGKSNNPLKFRSDSDYRDMCTNLDGYILYATEPDVDLLHYDINKDGPKTDAGRRFVAGARQTLYDFAFHLAIRETVSRWVRLEAYLRANYPKDAEMIILSLKRGEAYALEGLWSVFKVPPKDSKEGRKEKLGELALTVNGAVVTGQGNVRWDGTLKNDEIFLTHLPKSRQDLSHLPDASDELKDELLAKKPVREFRMKIVSPTLMSGIYTSPFYKYEKKGEKRRLVKYIPKDDWQVEFILKK